MCSLFFGLLLPATHVFLFSRFLLRSTHAILVFFGLHVFFGRLSCAWFIEICISENCPEYKNVEITIYCPFRKFILDFLIFNTLPPMYYHLCNGTRRCVFCTRNSQSKLMAKAMHPPFIPSRPHCCNPACTKRKTHIAKDITSSN